MVCGMAYTRVAGVRLLYLAAVIFFPIVTAALTSEVRSSRKAPSDIVRDSGYSEYDYSTIDGLNAAYRAGQFDPYAWLPVDYKAVRAAHGALATFTWLVLFPLGALVIRFSGLQPTTYVVWLHAKLQMAAYVLFIAAAGMGIWMAKHIRSLSTYHPMIGIILLVLLSIQPFTETFNHFLSQRFPRISRIFIHVHLWLGRCLLMLGIVNGGLGFLFASSFAWEGAPLAPRVAYGVVATLAWILYVGFAVVYPRIIDSRGWGRNVPGVRRDDGEEMALMRPSQYATSSVPQTPVAGQPTQTFTSPHMPPEEFGQAYASTVKRPYRDPLPEPKNYEQQLKNGYNV